jgi:hypothetical protein
VCLDANGQQSMPILQLKKVSSEVKLWLRKLKQ